MLIPSPAGAICQGHLAIIVLEAHSRGGTDGDGDPALALAQECAVLRRPSARTARARCGDERGNGLGPGQPVGKLGDGILKCGQKQAQHLSVARASSRLRGCSLSAKFRDEPVGLANLCDERLNEWLAQAISDSMTCEQCREPNPAPFLGRC